MDTRESGGRWEGRPILCKQEVMLVKGVLFVRGMLTLFSDELLFEPIRGIDKLAGAQELRFAVADMSEVEGDRQELSIVVKRKEVEFRGRGAARSSACAHFQPGSTDTGAGGDNGIDHNKN